MTSRHTWARIFIWIGVLAWIPYMALEYILQHDVEMTPYLTVHLIGVIPGTLLRRGPETLKWAKDKISKSGAHEKSPENELQ